MSTNNTLQKFPRCCDITGKGMSEGYVFNDGEKYIASEEDAKKYVESEGYNWEEEINNIDTSEEWFYWTDWELEEDENYFDADGVEYNPDGSIFVI